MRVRGGLAAALVAVIALALSGCIMAPRPVPSATSLPAGVTAELVQLRSDVAADQAQVEVHNAADDVLTIWGVQVYDPRLTGSAERPYARTSRIAAGGTADIRIQLPAARCPAKGDPGTTLVIRYQLGAESSIASTPISEQVPFLESWHDRECRAQALSHVARVSFTDFTPSDAGAPADLVLSVTPTGEGAAELSGIQTTNLLTFGQVAGDTADTYPIGVSVAAGDAVAPVEVHLPLVPLRCDAHAVQEDKRGTVFTVEAVIDGVPGEVEIAASETLRGRILTWIGSWCGFGG